MKRSLLALGLALFSGVVLAGRPTTIQYSIVDLGLLPGGGFSEALNVNDRGQIVGWGSTSTGESHAVLWQDGKAIDLGTLGGTSSRAWGINNSGQIVGESDTATGDGHAFLWEDGQMFDLAEAGPFNRAFAINDRSVVAGHFQSDGVLWRRGMLFDLGDLLVGWTINDHLVVGGAASFGDQIHAALWRRGETIDLGTLPGGTFSAARSVNNRNQVVGESTVDGTHGFIWEDGVMLQLPDLIQGTGATFARDINNRGQIVGESVSNQNAVGGAPHAVLWNDRNSAPLDLGTLAGTERSTAAAINDRGLIAGYSGAGGFTGHAVAWVPVRKD